MIRIFLVSLFFGSVFYSCNKKSGCDYDACNYTSPTSEIQAVQNYITNNSITATQHCSGLFYRIETAGSGKTPGYCSDVAVTYKGMLTNGNVFDQKTSPVSFNLGLLISAWRSALPLIKEGGRIILYVPPSLGYGNQANGSIPANSILIFEVDLISVQ